MNTQISRIKPKYLTIARRLIAGEKQCEIAFDIGMSESQLSVVVNSPVFQNILGELQAEATRDTFDVLGFAQEHTEKAAKKVAEVMDSTLAPPATQLSAARTILALGGHSPKVVHQSVQNNQYNLTFEQRMAQEQARLESVGD